MSHYLKLATLHTTYARILFCRFVLQAAKRRMRATTHESLCSTQSLLLSYGITEASDILSSIIRQELTFSVGSRLLLLMVKSMRQQRNNHCSAFGAKRFQVACYGSVARNCVGDGLDELGEVDVPAVCSWGK